MKDYQRKKTKYILPATVYHKTLWTIRDYHRIKDEVGTMIAPKSGGGGGAPSGEPGDPTFKMAVKYSDYLDILNAICIPLLIGNMSLVQDIGILINKLKVCIPCLLLG